MKEGADDSDGDDDIQPSRCNHVSASKSTTMKDILVSKKKDCFICNFNGKNRWLCLDDDCLTVFCGAKRNDHANSHAKNAGHALQLNLTTWKVWCQTCQDQVLSNCNIPGWPIGETLLSGKALQRLKASTVESRSKLASLSKKDSVDRPQIHRSPSRSSGYASLASTGTTSESETKPIADVQPGGVPGRQYVTREFPKAIFKDFEEEADDHNPRGLTGLRNLGNTCYMNAALQALSNCPPFSDHFRSFDQLPSTRAGQQPGIAEHFRELLFHLWSPARPGCLVPSRVLTMVRGCYPAFRGWQQQDSQEFLRCFLDLLHQDLKQPVYWWEQRKGESRSQCSQEESLTKNSSTDSVGSSNGDSDNFETADSGWSSDQEKERARVARVRKRHRSSSPDFTDARPDISRRRRPSPRKITKALKDEIIPKKKPVRYRSIVTNVFDGRISSTVECLTCKHVSETVETFQDLSLPIPTADQMERMRGPESSFSMQDVSVSQSQQQHHQQGWFSWAFGWIYNWYSWMRGPDICLQDCLTAFFSVDDLRGEDMYSCEKCGKLRNGLKLCRILSLPEMLCVHLKRFRHDMSYSAKVSTTVRFPIDDLDMTPYLHANCDSIIGHYELSAIVTHYGGAEGGHYVAYCRNELNRNWYEFDDSCVSVIDNLELIDKEAYVLFYQKRNDSMDRIRLEAQLRTEAKTKMNKGLSSFYISQEWLHRFGTFAEPGPITNYDFLCPHGYIAPSKATNLTDYYAEINGTTWDYLYENFGGGPVCTCLQYCLTCQQEHLRLQVKRTAELAAYKKLTRDAQNRPYDPKRLPNVISRFWFRLWEAFVLGNSQEPPGPIDQYSLLCSMPNGERYLRTSAAFMPLSRDLWEFFYSVYGGGPEVVYTYQPQPKMEEFKPNVEKVPRIELVEEVDPEPMEL